MNQVQGIIASILNDSSPVMGSWKSGYNCPVCRERRKRGNHRFESDGSFSYHCYNDNCGTGWKPGLYIGKKMTELLESFGATPKDIEEIKFYAKEIVDSGDFENIKSADEKLFESVTKYPMPSGALPIIDIINASGNNPLDKDFEKVLNGINERNPYLFDLDIYWCPSKKNRMHERFIIPYRKNKEIIGYTARHYDKNNKYRYFNQVSTSIFFNYDLLEDDAIQTILVLEGPIDAALAGGVSANNHTMNQRQIKALKLAQEQGKHIVIVPDRDKDGMNSINQALENGFSVSFPDYGIIREPGGVVRHIKDLDEACSTYGRLFCVQLIYSSICTDKFTIQSKINTWF